MYSAIGTLPEEWGYAEGDMISELDLDLSINKFVGQLPASWKNLKLSGIAAFSNSLTGLHAFDDSQDVVNVRLNDCKAAVRVCL